METWVEDLARLALELSFEHLPLTGPHPDDGTRRCRARHAKLCAFPVCIPLLMSTTGHSERLKT